jgi:hypothetical protein
LSTSSTQQQAQGGGGDASGGRRGGAQHQQQQFVEEDIGEAGPAGRGRTQSGGGGVGVAGGTRGGESGGKGAQSGPSGGPPGAQQHQGPGASDPWAAQPHAARGGRSHTAPAAAPPAPPPGPYNGPYAVRTGLTPVPMEAEGAGDEGGHTEEAKGWRAQSWGEVQPGYNQQYMEPPYSGGVPPHQQYGPEGEMYPPPPHAGLHGGPHGGPYPPAPWAGGPQAGYGSHPHMHQYPLPGVPPHMGGPPPPSEAVPEAGETEEDVSGVLSRIMGIPCCAWALGVGERRDWRVYCEVLT